MKILFCCHDFKRDNLRLMPWRYLYELSKELAKKGHIVSVLSINKSGLLEKEHIDGINVFPVHHKKLFSEKKAQKLLGDNDIVIWSASPLTCWFYKKLKAINKPLILLFTGPLYTISEIIKAQLHKVPFTQLASHYKNALVPLKLTSHLINADFVRKAVLLSERNANIFRNNGTAERKITVIPPGHDNEELKSFESKSITDLRKSKNLPENRKILTYLGSLYPIRGINVLLEAFRDASKKNNDLTLLILARTDKETEVESLYQRIEALGIRDKTIVISGYLDKGKVNGYIYLSDIIALPFILAPSDMPLGALEAMAMGKPVIATDVDGMPEMVKDRGLVVRAGNRNALAEAMVTLSRGSNLYSSLKANCVSFMSYYPTWEEVTKRFLTLIH